MPESGTFVSDGMKLHYLDWGSHFFPMEKPEALANVIEGFVSD